MYTLATPWDLTTASYTSVFANATYTANVTSIQYSNDGKKLYVLSSPAASNTRMTTYNLPTRWSIAGMSLYTIPSTNLTASSFIVSGNTFFNDATDFALVRSGEYGYYVKTSTYGSNTYSQIHYRSFNIPAHANSTFTVDATLTYPLMLGNTTSLSIGGIAVAGDGSKIWAVDNNRYVIYEYIVKS